MTATRECRGTGRIAEQRSSFAENILISGFIVKNVGDGQGNVNRVVYACTGGIMRKMPDMVTSGEGNTEQSVAVYNIKFGNTTISIQ